MKLSDKFHTNSLKIMLVILLALVAANLAYPAIRDNPPPPVQNHLPSVCLDGTTVCDSTNPMRGDFNNNGELDAGDLVIMIQAVMQ